MVDGMMVFLLAVLLVWLMLPVVQAEAGVKSEIHVSPDGDDANSGTVEQPFATLERARDELRTVEGGATVWVHGGSYALGQTFELNADASGSEDAPVVYRASEGEEVRLIGGRVVSAADFEPVTDSGVLDRLDPAAKNQVVQLDLNVMGIWNIGPFPDVFRDGGGLFELFVNGKRMPLSRWPNEGYVTMEKVIDPGDWSRGEDRRGGTFVYREDRPARWRVEDGLWLNGFWRVPWQPESVRVKAIDVAKRQITFAEPVGLGIGSKYAGPEGSGKEPYYALNLIEEINTPGEWCVNFRTKMLYFWPPEPLAECEVLISDDETPCVSLVETSHVRLQGFHFEGRLGNGVEIDGGTGNLVAGCTFTNLGGTGIIIRGGTNNGAVGCDIYEVGEGGVYISGGDRKTLTPCGNYVVNNHIHHYARRKKTYAPAILLGTAQMTGGSKAVMGAVGIRVAHNLIHDAPHAAVLYGGNDNIFEFNEIHDIALDSGDVGAFYTRLDWTSRGNVVRHNFIHHSPAANGVYLDDGDSGDTVYGNVFYQTASGAFIGGGHDNIVRNNIFVACKKAVHIDSRGVPRGYADNEQLLSKVREMNPKAPPWSTRYPEMVNVLEFHRDLPTGNVVENNVAFRCEKWLNLSGKKEHFRFMTIGANLEDRDPGFVDLDGLNLQLRADSPVYTELPGFERIPFEKTGLYVDAYRPVLPVDPRVRQRDMNEAVFDSETDMKRSNEQVKP